MRLICPNCGAQYEVADDVIPEDGRDVQCSNCAHTWFENRGASDIEDEFADVTEASETFNNDEDEIWGAEAYAPKPPAPPKPAPKRQELDPVIADILREEAAREAASRRAEAESAIQDQPDLGLDSADAAPDQRTAEVQKRMASLKGEPSPNKPIISPTAASRSGLLPDIEEINSSLRAESERDTGYDAPEQGVAKKKRGFRFGFFGSLFVLVLLLLAYVFAPKIIAAAPAAHGPLTAYVDTVDNGRLWLDQQMRAMLVSMDKSDAAEQDAALPEATAPAVETQAPEMAPVTE